LISIQTRPGKAMHQICALLLPDLDNRADSPAVFDLMPPGLAALLQQVVRLGPREECWCDPSQPVARITHILHRLGLLLV
jgi:hypothetical protein